MRTLEQHPWTHKPLAFFASLDLPALYPEKWAKWLAACEGDAGEARRMGAAFLAFSHSPVQGPITKRDHDKRTAFAVMFGNTYRWDRRRFLRHLRKSLHGNREAGRYWRVMTKGVRRG